MKNFKIGSRLFFAFFMIAATTGIMGGFAVIRMKAINISYHEMFENNSKTLEIIGGLGETYQKVRVRVLYMILEADVSKVDDHYGLAMGYKEDAEKQLTILKKKKLSQENQKSLKDLEENFQEYFKEIEVIARYARNNEDEAAINYVVAGMGAKGVAITNELDHIKDVNEKIENEVAQANEAAVQSSVMIMISLVLFAVAFAVLMGIIITRSITKPIQYCIDIAKDVANGKSDQDIVIESTDETGQLLQALQRMVEAIQRMTKDSLHLAESAVAGKLSTRADASKHEGDYRKIVQGFNDTMDAVIGPLSVTAQYVDDIAKGIIPSPITED